MLYKKNGSARLDKELAQQLQAYKDGLSEEEIQLIIEATAQLEAYQEEEELPESVCRVRSLRCHLPSHPRR